MIATARFKPLYEVKLIADGKNHFYQLEGDETYHPGATTVLGVLNKPALIPWAVKACSDNIRDYLIENALDKSLTKEEIEKACLEGKNIYKKKSSEAADMGSRVHQAIDRIIKGDKVDIPEDIKPGVQGFLDWSASNS